MKTTDKTIEIKVDRTIPAPPREVFDAWLDPKIPGNPWSMGDKLILDAKVDGLFYWSIQGTSHYGRFTELERPDRLRHTWVSPNTSGEESTVTVTFDKQGDHTLMTLVHAGLPDNEPARSHDKGWNYFLGAFAERFVDASAKKSATR